MSSHIPTISGCYKFIFRPNLLTIFPRRLKGTNPHLLAPSKSVSAHVRRVGHVLYDGVEAETRKTQACC